MGDKLIENALVILLLPILAFIIQIFLGKRLPRHGDWFCLGAIFIGLIISFKLFFFMLTHGDPNFIVEKSWKWLALGKNSIDLGIRVDNLSIIMSLVVLTVSFLVHLFSIEYMKGDPLYSRYFAYLCLFTFSMLGIVFGDNLLSIYIFWELVGISSYLLIGFWFHKTSASNASKKAFITNRVGDVGMLIGILLVFKYLGTFHLGSLKLLSYQDWVSGPWLTICGLCLFCGAIGKSAQFPLHVWLPDAMEGPTPVSALIHAATMVAAGVYFVARIYFLLTCEALLVIAYIGTITLFIGATIAIVQNDIKKVLAYSTISQLGYMIMGMGVGAYTASFFHLVTHAAFKACLFLGAGSIIHAMHHSMDHMHLHDDPQDMNYMGGLRKKMPLTFITFLVATLALCGFPLTSGFLSKDAILIHSIQFAWEHPIHSLIPILGFLTAGLTSFYMFRLIIKTFFGSFHYGDEKLDTVKENNGFITIPLVVLALLSIYCVYTFPSFSPIDSSKAWIVSLIHSPKIIEAHHGNHLEHTIHLIGLSLSIFVAVLGFIIAWVIYVKKMLDLDKLTNRFNGVYQFLLNKWNFDVIYFNSVIKMSENISEQAGAFDSAVIDGMVNDIAETAKEASKIHGWIDQNIVDRLVHFIAWCVDFFGWIMRIFQTGKVQTYMFWTVTSIIGCLSIWFLFN